MRRTAGLTPFFLLLLSFSVPASFARAASDKPNIVFILVDDMDAALPAFMPKTKALVAEAGVSFDSYFVNVSLCCPSRSTTLRGQYARNTTVLTNSPPNGGYAQFLAAHNDSSTAATWLQASGYRTAFYGKYLNGYPGNEKTYIPPGWNEWASPSGGSPYSEYDYQLNDNGRLVAYGHKASDYLTDVIAAKAESFVRKAGSDHVPFFLFLTPYAPHSPATPAPRHETLFAGARAPRPPSFNEADVSDKPEWVRTQPSMTRADEVALDGAYRKRLQSLQAVDEMVERLVTALSETGQLDRTYIFFTSDNGYHMGQHRLVQGKQAPYEEDIRVPLFVRGPGVSPASTLSHLAGNVDLAPTWAELAGAPIPSFVDGRSLVPLLHGASVDPAKFRRAFLIQHFTQQSEVEDLVDTEAAAKAFETGEVFKGTLEPPDTPQEISRPVPGAATPMPEFHGLRTSSQTYVEYEGGERELYDLKSDPYQLENIASTVAASEPDSLSRLSTMLHALVACEGDGCRSAETSGDPIPSSGPRLDIPAVLDAPGAAGSRYSSDLVVVNRGSTPARLALLYRAAPGTPWQGGPIITETLAAGSEFRIPDVIAWLRARGYSLTEGTSAIGSLAIWAPDALDPAAIFAGSRTSTPNSGAAGGSFGLFLPAVPGTAGTTPAVTVYGLREDGAFRSNLAIAEMSDGSGPPTLSIQAWDGDTGKAGGSPVSWVPSRGEWKQWTSVLAAAGVKNGWVTVTRTGGGSDTIQVYGVVNDGGSAGGGTSDGSYLEPGGSAGLLPIVLRLSSGGVLYSTELVLVNASAVPVDAKLTYTPSPQIASGPSVSGTVTIPAGRQVRIPDVIAHLRTTLGLALPAGESHAGTLLVEGVFALARTSCPNPDAVVGGTFGISYPASPGQKRASVEAWIHGLKQDGGSRSNLGIADARVGDASLVTYFVDVFDGETGGLAKTLGPYSFFGGEWMQISGVLTQAGASRGWARVRVASGASDFVAYGVLNDGAYPGAGTSDGSWLPMTVPEGTRR